MIITDVRSPINSIQDTNIPPRRDSLKRYQLEKTGISFDIL